MAVPSGKPPLTVPPTPPEPPQEPVLKALLDVTKAELDTEFKIAERYETKAHRFFAVAAGLFAITQAFVLRSDFSELSAARSDRLETSIIIAGCAFGLSVLAVMVATLQRSDWNFGHMQLFGMARQVDTQLSDVVQMYIVELGERREANKNRLLRTRVAQSISFVAALCAAVEFILAAVYFV